MTESEVLAAAAAIEEIAKGIDLLAKASGSRKDAVLAVLTCEVLDKYGVPEDLYRMAAARLWGG